MSESLDGRVAVVTGANSGIGAAVTDALVASGASVVINGRRADKLDARVAGNARMAAVAGDVLDPRLPEMLLKTALDRFGSCDICFNNAGCMVAGTIDEIDIEGVCHMVRVNVEAAFRIAHVFARHFRAQNKGHLVNTSSVLGTKVRPTAGAYAGTKYALEGLSEALRLEFARTNVKVTCLQPGLVMTELHDAWDVHPKEMQNVDRPLVPDDIARAFMYAVTQPDHVLVPRVMVLPMDHQI